MVAAYELSRAGWNCTILEASDRAGGRSLTVRGGDTLVEADSSQDVCFDSAGHLYANMGPARIPHHHTTLLGYCRDFGIDLEVFTNDNRAALFHNQDQFGGMPVTARRIHTDMRGYISELLAKAVSQGSLDDALTGMDKERVLQMLRSYGSLNPDLLYAGSSRGGYKGVRLNAGIAAGDIDTSLDFGELLKSEFWQYKMNFAQFLNQSPTLFQPVGGMDAIVNAFEERVGADIVYRSPVSEIRRTSEGVRVIHQTPNGGTAAVEADFAICTIPAPVLRHIPADFSQETRDTIAAIEFVKAVKIGFQAKRRFWELDSAIYGGISWTDLDITQIWYPSNGYHLEKGIVMGAYIWNREPGERFTGMDPQDRLREALAEGERLHAGYADEMECGISRAWANVPFQKGAWATDSEAVAGLRSPDGPIYFAGDQITDLSGWQEGAVLSAHSAIEAIHQRFSAR